MVKTVADWGKRHRRNRMSGWCALAAAGALAGLSSGTASAQCNYEVVGIVQAPPCPFVGPPDTFVAGMSSDGRVAGYYPICETAYWEAFVWTPNPDGNGGTFKTLPRPAGITSATATDVNSFGFVIGSHVFESGGTRGFIYDPQTQEFKYLQPADPGATHGIVSTVNAINDSNVVVGSRRISPPVPATSNAVIWHPFGINGEGPEVIVDLGVGDGPNSGALGGNDGTDAVGWSGNAWFSSNARALLWTNGATIDLGVLPRATTAHAKATNNFLEVVGESRDPSSFFRGFYWHKGKMIELQPPAPFDRFRPEDISDTGQIVGYFLPPAANHAALVQHGQFHQIQALVVNPVPNLNLSTAGKVNTKGQILGAGVLGSKIVGFLITPLNVPIADVNLDCTVDVHDLLYLLAEWGKADSNADLNGNGTVGVADLLILLANWSP